MWSLWLLRCLICSGSLSCGQSSLHPTGLGSWNTFSFSAGCVSGNWDCVNDQPANAGVGPAVAGKRAQLPVARMQPLDDTLVDHGSAAASLGTADAGDAEALTGSRPNRRYVGSDAAVLVGAP